MLEFNDIVESYERIAPYIHKTPIFSSQVLNQWLGHNILFKAECLQKVGAFKARGGCNAVAKIAAGSVHAERIIAQSSGNHAQAVAWAAQRFNLPATIFMPENVSQVKAQATKAYGAEVVFKKDRKAIDDAVEAKAKKSGTVWIHPYNDERVIAGQGTVALEIFDQVNEVDAIVAPCGGGGLLSGSSIVSRHLSPSTKMIGVEPLEANDAAQSLRTGNIVSLPAPPTTLADGARTLSVGHLTFPYLQQLDSFFEASEKSIAYWTQWLTHLLKLTIEPTSAMAMFGVCEWLKVQQTQKTVVVILSGGNIDKPSRDKIWSTDNLSQPPSLHD
ncbi:serine/threonine dehydratase [Pleionea sediminis]|uniref:serine/threonine dehydratase n=1 Tax=Pleionea sediminis TaxID=2569479 RepID=UPI0011849EFF|nr:serine/threonine dehydratase [Pleionea sediminis]